MSVCVCVCARACVYMRLACAHGASGKDIKHYRSLFGLFCVYMRLACAHGASGEDDPGVLILRPRLLPVSDYLVLEQLPKGFRV